MMDKAKALKKKQDDSDAQVQPISPIKRYPF
jgi:hypothetical protein